MNRNSIKYNLFVFKQIEKLLKDSGYEYLGEGYARTVYGLGNHVIKVPANSSGIYDNYMEGMAYKKYGNTLPNGTMIPRCKLLKNGCLEMAKVEKIDRYSNIYNISIYGKRKKYSWINNLQDGQIGIYRDKIVCYDFAFEVPNYQDVD